MNGRERVMAEAFGGAGWGVTLDELRHGANLLAAYGVNMQVLHGLFYSMATAEAAADWPPSLGHQNPYWPHFKGFCDYIARLSAVVGESRAATTVGILYPWTSIAANTADGRPNARARAIAEAYEGLIDSLTDASLDVQVVDERFISHGQARLENGRLRQEALTITTLILPPMPVISPQAMRRLGAFVRLGRQTRRRGRESVRQQRRRLETPPHHQGHRVPLRRRLGGGGGLNNRQGPHLPCPRAADGRG